ncbi:hypothetical protein ACLOJK_013555 [Asimina triloba]
MPPQTLTSLFLFLLFLHPANSLSGCNRHQQNHSSACAPFDCGHLTNIRFPFYRNEACGPPNFELLCEENSAWLSTEAGRLLEVKSISFREQLLRVVDTELLDQVAHGNCSLPEEIDYDKLGYRSDNEKNTHVEIMICYSSQADPVAACGRNNMLYRYENGSHRVRQRLEEIECSVTKRYLVRIDSVQVKPGGLVEVIEDGFYLNWTGDLECGQKGRRCQAHRSSGSGDGIHAKTEGLQQQIIGELSMSTQIVSQFKCSSLVDIYWVFETQNSNQLTRSRISIAVVQIISGSLIVVLMVIIVLAVITVKAQKFVATRMAKANPNVEDFLKDYRALMPTRYSCKDIRKITNGLRQKLGQGGSGCVFKGKLSNGDPVAVKVLNKASECAAAFINEVTTIGRTHHVNVVGLLGFCSEGQKRALVYEFMPNGSLEKFIYAKGNRASGLHWEKIQEIALGIARGIWYLHQGCNMQITHFDIKPHNILLDRDFNPKISDFGLAESCSKEKKIISSMAARGTLGYIAPELFSKSFGPVSCKSDVYSYGMLILEMVGRRKIDHVDVENPSQVYFPAWAYDQLQQGGKLELGEMSEGDEKIVKKMAIVGIWCIQMKPADRPCMKMVVQMLEGTLENLHMPPKPYMSPCRGGILCMIAERSQQ